MYGFGLYSFDLYGGGEGAPERPSLTKAIMDENLDGASVELEILSILNRSDGSTLTQGNLKTLTIQGASMDAGEVRLNLVSLEDVKLDQVYPSASYEVSDYSELLETEVGKPICKVIGLGIKTPGAIIKTGSGTGPWRIAFCETGPTAQKATGSQDGILTVYRNNRILDSGDYSVVEDTSGSTDVLCIEFTDEADVIDFQGNWYEFAADIRDTTSVSRNVATEIERLLGEAGVSVDSDSITDAESYATDESMLMDYAYGRDGQRTYKAHLEDLLFILRGGLKRDASGNYVLFQDKEGGSATRYDEDAGHPVEFSNYERPPRHTSIALSYKPSIQDTSRLRHTITRSVTGGTLGDAKPREIPQLMDHTAAGKLADYLSKREQYNRRIEIYTAQDQFEPTKLIGGKNDNLWDGEKLWQVRSASLVPAGSSVTAWEYDPSVYATSAGTPPSDATTGYQPDYSNTPPDAPTSLSVDDSDAVVNDDGGVTSWATVSATPPSVNFQRMIFQAVNDTTNEVTTQEGEAVSSGDWETTFASLRPNANYTIFAFGRNKFGIDGVTDSVAHSTATEAGAPTAPTAVNVKQFKVSSYVEAVAEGSVPSDFSHTEWQFEVNGSGTWTDKDSRERIVIHDAGGYGSSYKFRARFVDTSGNASGWTTSSSQAIASNVGTTDIVSGGVQTSNIATGNVTTPTIADDDVTTDKRQNFNSVVGSAGFTSGGEIDEVILSINEPKPPMVVSRGGINISNEAAVPTHIGSISTSTIDTFFSYRDSSGTDPGKSISIGVQCDYW